MRLVLSRDIRHWSLARAGRAGFCAMLAVHCQHTLHLIRRPVMSTYRSRSLGRCVVDLAVPTVRQPVERSGAGDVEQSVAAVRLLWRHRADLAWARASPLMLAIVWCDVAIAGGGPGRRACRLGAEAFASISTRKRATHG